MYGYEVSLVDNEYEIRPLAQTVSTGIVNGRGLPGYTSERAAGELWRSASTPREISLSRRVAAEST